MTVNRRTAAAYLALTAAGLIWGSAFYFAKIAEPYLDVGQMMLLRFVFASLAFVPFLFRGVPKLTPRDWRAVGMAALIGVPVQFLLQFEGLARTTVSHASLMIGTAPVLIAVAGYLFLRDRLRLIVWAALGISTVGVGLLLVPGRAVDIPVGSGGSLAGDLLVLVSISGGVTWVLLSKRLMERHSPSAISALTTIIGTVLLAAWVLPREGVPPLNLPTHIWLDIITLGVVTTTITTLLWNFGLQRVSAGKAAIFINLEPVVGTILGVSLLGDALGAFSLFGGAMIVGSAVVVSTAVD